MGNGEIPGPGMYEMGVSDGGRGARFSQDVKLKQYI